MKPIYRKLPPLLTALALLLALTACGGGQRKPFPPDGGPAASAGPASTRTIIDGAGRAVEIPVEVTRIVPLGNTPRMIVYLGLAGRVVGIEECEIASTPLQAYAYPYREQWSGLPNCGTNSMGETAYYPEEIMLAAPDVIFCTDPAGVADDLQAQTGIPTVAVSQGTLFGEDYEQSLRILANACGAGERAEEVISFIHACLDDLSARAGSAAGGGKPAVLGAGASFKGGHSIDGIYTDYSVFRILSANDVASEIAGRTGSSGVMVDREQILAWDPDMIFFDSGNMDLVRADYAENPAYFQQLQAVRSGRLYQWPNSTWHWPNVEIPLVSAYYTGSLLYPDAFAGVDFRQKAGEIFGFFLGEPDYLTLLESVGAGYGPVTLGE